MYGFYVIILVAILSVTAVPLNETKPYAKCGYESCTQHEPDKLNVHIVPHTHDDVGWVETANKYYKKSVRGILDTVVDELWKDPKRRFVYVESFYFFKWWNQQNSDVKDKVGTLVAEGRLQFAGGAWSMNDEATTSYQSIIDQFTYGLKQLNKTFGACGTPRVAWQIDPFGHSREFASLMAAMGYDGLFVNRINYAEKEHRKESRLLEMIWRGDDVLGKSSDIFTSALFDGYDAPSGFCFDGEACESRMAYLKEDGPQMDEEVSKFITYVTKSSLYLGTNNLLIPMGGDFHYTTGTTWFSTLDKLIKFTNLKSEKMNLTVKLFYSTPQCYLKAVHDANKTFPTKEDDFFPYVSDKYSYWTGYYTSRPTLKYLERVANTVLQMAKQLQVFGNLEDNMQVISNLKSAMGMVQHHDGITGTARQEVANDYVTILSQAVDDAHIMLREAFTKLMVDHLDDAPHLSFTSCRLNESSCLVSETSKQLVVSIYNPLAWSIKEPMRIPVVDGNYEVYGPDGKIVVSQLVPIPKAVLDIPTRVSEATHEVVFIAEFRPLALKNYFIRFVNEKRVKRSELKEPNQSNGEIETWNERIWKTENSELYFNWKTGEFIATQQPNGLSTKLKINYGYYIGHNDSDYESSASGAYVFSTLNNIPENISIQINDESSGRVVQEIYLRSDKNIASTIRLYDDLNFIENDWVVGPINVSDNNGKEYVVNYVTSINNRNKFYTDSNGRQLMRRESRKRAQLPWQPAVERTVASDYYPVTNQIVIQDGNIPTKLSVITDRSEGASSLQDGHIELMLHRRLLQDDGYGMQEELNETVLNGTIGLVARGRHRLVFGKPDNEYETEEKEIVKQFNLQPQVFVSAAEDVHLSAWLTFKNNLGFANNIPRGLHLLTLEPWGDKLLVRLENYLDVSAGTRTTIKIDLNTIFTSINIKSYKETTLAANRLMEDLHRWSWNVDDTFKFTNTDEDLAGPNVDNNLKVEIKAKQIRTFVVDYEIKEACKVFMQ